MIRCDPLSDSDISMRKRTLFMAKFDYKPYGCWNWTATKTAEGYGRFGIATRHLVPAHRVAYALFYGHLAAGLTVDHLCGNPSCVNPGHLDAVTHEENLRRSTKGACAMHSRKTHCPRGHDYSDYTHPKSGRTQRVCWTCRREQKRAWMRKKRGSDPARFRV